MDIFACGSDSLMQNNTSTIYLNQAGKSFINSNIFFPSISDGSADWGDFDNDGDLDLLLTGLISHQTGEVICRIYKNNFPSGFVPYDFTSKGIYRGIAKWIDFDNDGDLDIFTSGINETNQISAYLYINSKGIFYKRPERFLSVYDGSATICDVDKDRDMDIILSGKTNAGDAITSILVNNSDGIFEQVDAQLPGVYNSYISWGDYDSDGFADLLITGSTIDDQESGISEIYKNQGSLSFKYVNSHLMGIHSGIGLWGDCDNDGKIDILISGSVQNENKFSINYTTKVYLNKGSSFAELTNTPFLDFVNSSGSWGDYDNDNDLDIVIEGLHNETSVTRIYNNNADVPNSIPVEPKGLTTSIDNGNDNSVTLQWLPGFDDNSSYTTLTYNLRVGTTPGGCEIMAPPSDPNSGCLKMPVRGNVDNNKSWFLKLPPGTYYWSVQSVDDSFAGSAFSSEQSFTIKNTVGITQLNSFAEKFDIYQNYPNPFNPSTTIRYSLPGRSNVNLTIFNIAGQKVIQLVNEQLSAGTYESIWNGKTSSGETLPSGIYISTITTDYGVKSGKMLLVK